MNKNKNFCNNCGNFGHIFPHCKSPITSLGIIAIREGPQDKEYLMIRRKDSLGYVDFLRGRYNINNVEYIQNIIDELTFDERQRIIQHNFDTLWKGLWGENPSLQYRIEEKDSKIKFNTLKTGIIVKARFYSLRTFVFDSKTKWIEQEWGFPKGRRNYKESNINCALREFEEETGYDKKTISLIQNLTPLEEIFTGSNYKSYKHCYFIGFIDYDVLPKTHYQKSEVSKLEWKKYDDVLKCIRKYNIEKKNMVKHTKEILDTCEIYY